MSRPLFVFTLSGVMLAVLIIAAPTVLEAAGNTSGVDEGDRAPEPAGATLPPATASNTASGVEALDYGFRFASAIRVDPKDMGRAQESVLLDYIEADALDEALARADRVEGWRRATVTADLAAALAGYGRRDEARALIARAEEQRLATEGWQERRIAAHIAQALALLGDLERSGALAAELAAGDALQYAGRATATLAAGQAAAGDADAAMASLRRLASEQDPDAMEWRTTGYLQIARQEGLAVAKRREALDAALRSAQGLQGWKKAETLERVAEEYRRAGRNGPARAALQDAEVTAGHLPSSMPVKAPLLSRLAAGWARLAQKERATALLEQAQALAPAAPPIDRPAIYAGIASTRLQSGDEAGARRSFAQALSETEALVNARPRALAAVEICRSLGRSRLPLDAGTRARLDSLLAGLREPW